ncbi:rRNA maturation protein Nop10 [Anaerotaenia torta]|uniref:hypothetical protein n=1 Tax=Anaerotaenia torta TaxID=433293 RepID=UPI003D1A9CC1
MSRTLMINTSRKCLKCGTYHSLDRDHCPECGRYLYIMGSMYQPKVRKGADRHS